MSSFERRERAFETKFAHDLEMSFRINARRNKLFGFWAAEKLGLDALSAQEYAQGAVLADFEAHDAHQEVIEKVKSDLAHAAIDLSYGEIEEMYDMLMDEALSQLQKSA